MEKSSLRQNRRSRLTMVTLCFLVLSFLYNNCGSPGFQTSADDAVLNSESSTPNPNPNPNPTPSPLPGPQPQPTPNPASQSSCLDSKMKRIAVTSLSELSTAIANASPGDAIEIQAGTYRLKSNLSLNKSGTSSLPICLRAANPGAVVLESESAGYMAIKVSGTFWIVENLTIKGVCASDDLCEHAFQIKETAHNTVIRNNTLTDFNAQIKGSSSGQLASDNVVIENNHFYDSRPRQTSNPTTKIDVVGGKYWVIRGNYIHDFQKGQGDGISYAAFLKGYSRYGLFENNIVACSLNFSGGTRIGLSFGGGTTGPQFCWDYNPATGKGCAYEHEFGMMRNNLILNCSDVGILIRDTHQSVITNNLVIDTMGIDSLLDAGRPVPTSEVSRNIVHGQIRDRNGAVSIRKDNLTSTNRATVATWFRNIDQYDYTYVNSGVFRDISNPVADVTTDICGQARDGKLDLGPFEWQNSNCFQNVMDRIKAGKR